MRAICLLMSALLFVSGCAGRPTVTPGADRIVSGSSDSIQDYKLGVGDKIRVIVYNEDSLSGEFQVSGAGDVALPLVGNIKADGKTTDQIASEYHDKLADGYLRDPRVSIEILTYRPYFILGEVKTPGQYPYSTGLTVVNAIAAAQGETPRADHNVVLIRRSGSSEEKPYKRTPDLAVLPGDTIRLPERLF